MIVNHPAKFHNEKIPKRYRMVSKTVRTGMVRHLRILLRYAHDMCKCDIFGVKTPIDRHVAIFHTCLDVACQNAGIHFYRRRPE